MIEPYSCVRDCKTKRGFSHRLTWDHRKRSARGCVHPDLPTVRHRLEQAAFHEPRSTPYMGRWPDSDLDGTSDLGQRIKGEFPNEASEDGCPGAWYRTPFVISLEPYERLRAADGQRVPNFRFDAAPWQVKAAIQYFETEQERSEIHVHNIKEKRRRSAEEARAAAKPGARGAALGRPGHNRR